jgi:glycosyltransferase 2 family protein
MTTRPRNPGLSKIVNGALVLLAFALLAFVIWRNREEINRVFSRRLDFRLFALALCIYMVSVVLTFVRWFMLVRVIEPNFKLGATLVLGSIGMVFNLVIPGGVGGDLIKASYLVRMRIRRTQAIASMVIDRILGLLALFILAAVSGAIAWGGAARDVRTLAVLAWLAVLAGVLVLVAIFTGAFSRMFPRAAGNGSKFGLIVSELREMSTTYRGRLGVVFGCLALSVIIHALNVLAFFLVGCMLYPEMPTTLAQHFSMVPLILFTLAVPLPFGALGVTEMVGGQLLRLVGHPDGELAMMGFRVVMYAAGLVCACVYLTKLKEVRELTSAARQLEDEPEDDIASQRPASVPENTSSSDDREPG